MFVSATLVASVLVATQALAVNQVVTVGRNGAKQFSPNNIQAAIGDTIEFQYVAGMHSVTQSTFATPCEQMVNATAGTKGFDSGIVPGDAAAPQSFIIAVNTTKPIWVFCKQTGHCQAGMVMAINAPATGNTFDAYLANAEGKAAASSGRSSSAAAATGGATGTGAGAVGGNATASSSAPASSSTTGGSSRTASTSALAYGLSGIIAMAVGVSTLC